MTLEKYAPIVQKIAEVVDYVMLNRLGLFPPERYALDALNGRVMVVASFNPLQIGKSLAQYENPDVARRLSQALDGLPVVVTQKTGLNYVISLSGKPKFPKTVPLPEEQMPGRVYLGVRHTGQAVARPWSQLGHMMVAGKTGSGKSNGLRLIAYQALRDNFLLAISDNDMVTFPMLQNSPSLFAPIADTPQAAMELLERLYAECEARKALYQTMPGYPETLDEYNRLALEHGREPLRPILAVLDEVSNTIIQLNGKGRKFTDLLGAVGMRTRKFGLWVVFAAHEFTKDQIGLIRPQCETIMVYRNEAAEMSRLMGCEGAERIPQGAVGRMVTNKWGMLQTYFVDKARLGGNDAPACPIPEAQAELVHRSLAEAGGRMSIPLLKSWGLGEREARALLEAWELRGWVKADPSQKNARFVTEKMTEIVSNCQTGQTASNWQIQCQTGVKLSQTPNLETA